MRRYIFLYFLLGLVLTGCSPPQKQPDLRNLVDFVDRQSAISEPIVEGEKKPIIKEIKDTIVISDIEWRRIDSGFEIKNYSIKQDGQKIDEALVARFDPKSYGFEILQDIKEPKTITQWSEISDGVMFINGVYFNEENQSTGGLIIKNETFGVLTTDGKNGYTGMLLMNDSGIELRYLPEKNLLAGENFFFGLQTYPTLIRPGGVKNISENSEKRARRTIIARDTVDKILIITIPKPSLSLYEVMNFLYDSDLKIDFAINFDGGPSSGAVIDYNDFHYEIPSWPIPHVVVIKKI